MALRPNAARDLLKLYLPEWRSNRQQMDEWDRWHRGKFREADKPRLQNATREYKELRDRSFTPWLSLVVTSTAQGLYVDHYRRSDEAENAQAWEAWQRNGMDARQLAVHRGAVGLGLSYVKILPGELNDEPIPRIRGVSARRGVAFYADMDDDWPLYFVEGERLDATRERFWLWDNLEVHSFTVEDDKISYEEFQTHGFGECPFVQFSNLRDLDSRTMGEVEAFLDMAARIDQDTFDRLVAQRFNAWLLRWIAGMEVPGKTVDEDGNETIDQAANRAKKLKLAAEDILIAEDADTKFGAFPQAALDGFISARDADIRDLAAVSQTPPHHLLGHVANLSADALAAAEAGLTRKIGERKQSFGESWEQVFRAASIQMGGEEDFQAQVGWRDTESRSLAQVADALGKLVQMLGIPPQALWEKAAEAMGRPQQDVERWKELADENDAVISMLREVTDGLPPDDAA